MVFRRPIVGAGVAAALVVLVSSLGLIAANTPIGERFPNVTFALMLLLVLSWPGITVANFAAGDTRAYSIALEAFTNWLLYYLLFVLLALLALRRGENKVRVRS